jgi:hypothetical protein
MHVEMRLRAVARVPARAQLCAGADPVTGSDADRSALQVNGDRRAAWSISPSWTATTRESTGARTGIPNPTNRSTGSVARAVRQSRTDAVRRRGSTATKSNANVCPPKWVPWLGTRSEGVRTVTHGPRNGSRSSTGGRSGSGR